MESNPIFDPFLLTLITLVLEDFPFSSHHLYLSYLLSKCYSFLTIQNPSHTFAKTAPVFTSFPSTVSTVDVFSFRVPEIALKAAIADVRFTISVPIPTFPQPPGKCRISDSSSHPQPREWGDLLPGCGTQSGEDACGSTWRPLGSSW